MDIHIFVFFPKEISREKDENMNICTPLSNIALVTDLYGNALDLLNSTSGSLCKVSMD